MSTPPSTLPPQCCCCWAGCEIKRQNVQIHKKLMISACVVSSLFLVFYLLHKIWKAQAGGELHTTFNADGLLKYFYLLILITHLVLAMTVPVFAAVLLVLVFAARIRLIAASPDLPGRSGCMFP
ncbi:MAG: DUF420 domain-containing protein [Phycisphaerales bacterium]|nr:DUF420 domain-containing protein [Phycisphaerales bacterium]